MLTLKFEGVDWWSRPVFKDVNSNHRFGSVDKLCSDMDEVRSVTVHDLVYFGTEFDCEPLGGSFKEGAEVEIVV